MPKYVDCEVVKDKLSRTLCLYEDLPALIDSIPAADVRHVVRGRWELDSDPGEPWRYVCNICGEKTKDTVMGKPRANFCPNCGADMREES